MWRPCRLALGMVGIYGVVAFGVRQRLREIGLRMALGARTSSVMRMVVIQGLGYALAGIALGLSVTLALTRLMRGVVFGISPADPLTFTTVPLTLLAVAAFASWLPARRAARVDPSTILRE